MHLGHHKVQHNQPESLSGSVSSPLAGVPPAMDGSGVHHVSDSGEYDALLTPDAALSISRHRVCILAMWFLLLTILTVGGTLVFINYQQMSTRLNADLVQAVTSCRHFLAHYDEWLSEQGKTLSEDPIITQYHEALALSDENYDDPESLRQTLSEELQHALSGLECDFVIMVGEDGKVDVCEERRAAAYEGKDPVASATEEVDTHLLPQKGDDVDADLLKTVMDVPDVAIGFGNISQESPLCELMVVPLRKNNRFDGALIVGDWVTERKLGDVCRGLLDGAVVAVAQNKIVATYDLRSARPIAPALLSPLEEALAFWSPAAIVSETDKEPTVVKPLEFDLAGMNWREQEIPLSNIKGGSAPGYLMFLADPTDLYYCRRMALIWGGLAALVLLLVAYPLLWGFSKWVLRPVCTNKLY